MTKTETDQQGRLYLPKELREEYGEKYRIVPFKGEIRLIPVAEDPVSDLRERTKTLRKSDKSVEELKEEAREKLKEEAG
ncbi:MAG: AbrB/MazE/SpoVT family DNA-binding domain-containing protein [Candidatus Nanohaloarchaeota archaeon QJJ-9]|nr:AbrB/MazE/SpoVT family DNA-binding domain-containing protein [Candidatus Nanohaloarchaeota archaeon QJJ-9]